MLKQLIIGMVVLMVAVVAIAQDKDIRREEITIRRLGNKQEKMTIVIDGDSITVNGKPLGKEGGNVVIERRIRDGGPGSVGQMNPRKRIMTMPREGFPLDEEFFMEEGEPGQPQAFLGVNIEKADRGVRVVSVSGGSAAEKAGLAEGDVLLSVAGKSASDPEAFRNLIRAQKPEEEVDVVYIRKGESKERKMKLRLGSTASMPKQFRFTVPEAPMRPGAPTRPGTPRVEMFRGLPGDLGPMIERELERSLDWKQDRPQLGIMIQDTQDGNGVKVLEVKEGSPAAQAGVKIEDIITSIDGREISDTDVARNALQSAREKNAYSLSVKRGNKTIELQVKIPKKLKKATL